MNVALNGNEVLFIFLLLHLPKHSSYMRLCALAKNLIFSTNAFTKAHFLFSRKRPKLQKGTGSVAGPQKKDRKIEFLSKINQADHVKPRTRCSGVTAVKQNLIDDFSISR